MKVFEYARELHYRFGFVWQYVAYYVCETWSGTYFCEQKVYSGFLVGYFRIFCRYNLLADIRMLLNIVVNGSVGLKLYALGFCLQILVVHFSGMIDM